MEWSIFISEEYDEWFSALPQKHKMAITTDLAVLRNLGPMLGRPYVDQIKGSKYNNLKELRTQIAGHVYRSLFAFDPERHAVILVGGDKKGKDQDKFYKRLIAQAEIVFDNHLKNLEGK